MKLADILCLVNAGYTREEIEQMENPQPADTNPVPAVQPVATPIPVAEPANPSAQVAEPVAVAVPQPAQQEAQPTMAEIMQSIAKLTSAVQANAIAQSVIPAGISNPPSAEDMLAEIIRPSYKERV